VVMRTVVVALTTGLVLLVLAACTVSSEPADDAVDEDATETPVMDTPQTDDEADDVVVDDATDDTTVDDAVTDDDATDDAVDDATDDAVTDDDDVTDDATDDAVDDAVTDDDDATDDATDDAVTDDDDATDDATDDAVTDDDDVADDATDDAVDDAVTDDDEVEATEHIIEIVEPLDFSPAEITIAPGDTVTWVNNTDVVHTSTADPELAEDPNNVQLPEGAETWHSGNIEPGEEYSVTLDVPGTYMYICYPHELAGMLGVIIVEDEEAEVDDPAVTEDDDTEDVDDDDVEPAPDVDDTDDYVEPEPEPEYDGKDRN
jgi:plastocyanin